MNMFQPFLASIPKNRSEMVNHLDLPEDLRFSYTCSEPEESVTVRSDSVLSGSYDECATEADVTVSTDSSIPLSRAMTDSEIDYEMFRRYKSRSSSEPWVHMRDALDSFPPSYIASLNSFQNSSSDLTEDSSTCSKPVFNEELKLKMERFFEEDCAVFTPDDPGLLDLQDALESVDLKTLDSDVESLTP